LKSEREGQIRRYGYKVILFHWAFILTFSVMFFPGLKMARDWFFHHFKIYGVIEFVHAPSWLPTLHGWMGLVVLVLGLLHILMHVSQREKKMLTTSTVADIRATLHTLLFLFWMASREERGDQGKYRGNQRVAYIATIYTLGLSGLTGLFVWLGWLGEIGVILHVIAGALVGLLAAYRVAYLVRKRDGTAAKCVLATGTMPEWYVRKNHPRWYREVKGGYSAPPDLNFEQKEGSENATEAEA